MERTDRIPALGSHAVRTANIHCVLHFEAFAILKRGIYILISAFGLRTPKSILYIALLGPHALRTKNIHCVLCFGAFTFSERRTVLRTPALGLRRALYRPSRYENEEYSSCFALWGTFSERRTCIILSLFVSRAIHGSYKFDRIHQYVNNYAVHQLYDS